MAGVVASTLRRKAFKKSGVALFPAVEGKVQQSLEVSSNTNTSCTGSTAISTIISSSTATYSPTLKLAAGFSAATGEGDRSSPVSDTSSILGSPTSPFLTSSSSPSASEQEDETSRFCPKRKEKKSKSRHPKFPSTSTSTNHYHKGAKQDGHKTKSASKGSRHSKSNQRQHSIVEEGERCNVKSTEDHGQNRISSRLCLVDFWPASLTPYELNMDKVKLESFDMLIPKANIWLLENPETHVIKCETIEKKVYNLDDVISQNVLFRPLVPSKHAFYVKGLRIWYVKNLEPGDSGFQGNRGAVKPPENEESRASKASFCCHGNDEEFRHCCRTSGHVISSRQQDHHHQQQQQQSQQHQHQCCGCCSLPDLTNSDKNIEQQQQQQQQQQHSSFGRRKSTEDSRPCAYSPALDDDSLPLTIGYMNVIPRCTNYTSKYPEYEEIPETYSAVSTYLSDYPLEGKIVTIETVPLKLTNHRARQKPEIDPNQTFFPDAYLRHILYITRIYFRYGKPRIEIIGAQDFLPDRDSTSSFYNFKPQYKGLSSAVSKVQSWMKKIKNVSITNVQTLETAFKQSPSDVRTGSNFLDKSESHSTVKFIRVTYTRPFLGRELDAFSPAKFIEGQMTLNCQQESVDIEALDNLGVENIPVDFFRNRKPSKTDVAFSRKMEDKPRHYRGFSYKTFVPAPVKVAMCSGVPEYEGFNSTLERAKIWLKCVNRQIISVESLSHPLTNIWNDQDGGEATVCHGEWTSSGRKKRKHLGRRRSLVYLVRVYLDGSYQEPSAHLIPPTPLVEEIKDCACTIM